MTVPVGQRENIIRISMKPIAETIPPIIDSNAPSSPTSPGAHGLDGTTSLVPKQFNVVKKNAIQLSSLPQTNLTRPRSNSDDLKLTRSSQESRRSNRVGQRSGERKTHSRSKSLEPKRNRERVRSEPRTKQSEKEEERGEEPVVELSVNGTVLNSQSQSTRFEQTKEELDRKNEESCKNEPIPRSPRSKTKSVRGKVMEGTGQTSDTSLDQDSRKTSSEEVDQSDDSFSFKDELMKRVGADDSTEDDSSVSEERRKVSIRSRSNSQSRNGRLLSDVPKQDSVKKLREKFLKIDDMLEEKHRHKYQKKQQDLKRELRSVAAWKQLSEDVQGKSANKKGRFRVADLERTRGSNVQRLKNKFLNEVENTASPTRKSIKPSEDCNGLQSSNTTSQGDNLSNSALSDSRDSTSSMSAAQESVSSITDDNSEQDSMASVSETLENACQELKAMKQPLGKHDDASIPATSPQPSPKRPRKHEELKEEKIDNTNEATAPDKIKIKFQESPSTDPLDDDLGQRLSPQASPKRPRKNIDCEDKEVNQNTNPAKVIKQIEINFIGPGSKERRPSFSSIKCQDKSLPSFPNSPDCSPSSSPKGSPNLSRKTETFTFQETDNINQKDNSEILPPQSPSVVSLGSGSSSSCSTPRMSIIIAQEPSSTKINSRYFTIETCAPEGYGKDEYAIMEENDMGMDVEGEFRFDSENNRQRKAERRAFRSLQKGVKVCSEKSALVKDEEIRLSQSQIEAELQALEMMHNELEERGIAMEKILRGSADCKYHHAFKGHSRGIAHVQNWSRV